MADAVSEHVLSVMDTLQHEDETGGIHSSIWEQFRHDYAPKPVGDAEADAARNAVIATVARIRAEFLDKHCASFAFHAKLSALLDAILKDAGEEAR